MTYNWVDSHFIREAWNPFVSISQRAMIRPFDIKSPLPSDSRALLTPSLIHLGNIMLWLHQLLLWELEAFRFSSWAERSLWSFLNCISNEGSFFTLWILNTIIRESSCLRHMSLMMTLSCCRGKPPRLACQEISSTSDKNALGTDENPLGKCMSAMK